MLVIISLYRTALRQKIAAFLRNCLSALRMRKRGSLPQQEKTSTACATDKTSELRESWSTADRMRLMTAMNWRSKLIYSIRNKATQPEKLLLMAMYLDEVEKNLLALVPEDLLRELDIQPL
jgi:hypothetical protein